MKITILFTLVILMIFTGCSDRRSSSVNAILGDAGYEKKFGVLPGPGTPEALRISTHLEYVEGLLRRTDVSSLTTEQAAHRSHLLDLLHAYRLAGIFPVNARYRERTPCFIDDAGRICAVGYLVEKTAGRPAAEAINKKHQYERILDMKDASLEKWIASSGLTKMECAMIQPSYNWYPQPIYTDNNHISRDYGVTSAIVGGMNLSLNVINGVQLSRGTENKAVPALGLILGTFQLVYGIHNMPEQQYDMNGNDMTNESQQTLSFVNIGIGTSAILLSAWNLFDHRTLPKRTAWNVYGIPGESPGLGFSLAHRF